MDTAELPGDLRRPSGVALAKAAEQLPEAGALRGGCMYEPKWDGYRAVAVCSDDAVRIWSRNGTDLTDRFPEVARALTQSVPPRCVLDGELVAWSENRLNFAALQRRMAAAAKMVPGMARRSPVTFVVFDLLAVAGHDIRGQGFRHRRELLEELAKDWAPPLQLSPVTTDPDQARTWLQEWHVAGIEGVVAKGAEQRYEAGRRQWLKVKYRHSIDVVLGAVIGARNRPRELVIGLHREGELKIAGRTSALNDRAARELAPLLREPAGEHPWPTRITSGVVSGWGSRKEAVLTLVEPVVVEVSADVAFSGTSWRHPLRYLRPRPDLDPRQAVGPDAR